MRGRFCRPKGANDSDEELKSIRLDVDLVHRLGAGERLIRRKKRLRGEAFVGGGIPWHQIV